MELACSGVADRDLWTWQEICAYLTLCIGAQGKLFEVVLLDFEDELANIRQRARAEAVAMNVDAEVLAVFHAAQHPPGLKYPLKNRPTGRRRRRKRPQRPEDRIRRRLW